MSLRRLRYFVAAAEAQSIGRAASRLNVAASALSRQIASLEDELETQLFERTGRQVRLSREGYFYLRHVREALRILDNAKLDLRGLSSGAPGHLQIGLQEWSGLHRTVQQSFQTFRTSLPQCELRIKPLPSNTQISALVSGLIDGGFLYDLPEQGELQTINISTEYWMAAFPETHRLFDLAEIRLIDLTDENFVSLRSNLTVGVIISLEKRLHEAGIYRRIVQEAATHAEMMSLVAAGVGIAIVNTAVIPPPGVTTRRIADLDMSLNFNFAWRRENRNPLLRQMVEIVRSLTSGTASGMAGS